MNFKDLLQSAVDETGVSLGASVDDVALYAEQRTAVLAPLIGLEGFEQAVIAERDNVAMFAALNMHGAATNADAQILGLIQGALFFSAQNA